METDDLSLWRIGMQEGVRDYFGPDSKNSLAIGTTTGVAQLHLHSLIDDEDKFLACLPPNRRSITPKYGDNGEKYMLYEFKPDFEQEQQCPVPPQTPASVVQEPPVVLPPPPVKKHSACAWSILIIGNAVLICVVAILARVTNQV